ncbi:MAG: hypothetical protein NZ853_05930 [Leptospiraceae bacterium]|nr:hypothetical protein [Leptospiraceae bacterium]MDW7976512.1 glycosyltransferase N-terminal domain-containing protein [Leptospiraceae bacterium]
MGLLIYNFLITLAFSTYQILARIHPKVKVFHQHRQEGKTRIKNFLSRQKERKILWLHASSVGELDQALALFRFIKKLHPQIPVLITVFSESVKNLDKIPSDEKAYLPIDFPWQWKFLNDKVLAFITFTWDVFPNLLKTLKLKNTYTFLCSAAIEKDSYKIRNRSFFRFLYENLDGIGVVDEENLIHFQKLYSGNIKITGDTRYETIYYKLQNQSLKKEFEEKLQIDQEIIILASTYTKCEEELLPHLSNLIKETQRKVWIFPHFVQEKRIHEIKERLNQYQIPYVVFSDEEFFRKYQASQVVIVDVLGILAYAYTRSKICYVGGAFHHRVHNTGEPAFCGSIPFTGPRIYASPTAVLLEKHQFLFSHSNGKSLIQHMIQLLKDPITLNSKREEMIKLVSSQLGASEKFYHEFLRKVIVSSQKFHSLSS